MLDLLLPLSLLLAADSDFEARIPKTPSYRALVYRPCLISACKLSC